MNELGVERGQHDGRRRRHARWSGWGRRGEAVHGGIIRARLIQKFSPPSKGHTKNANIEIHQLSDELSFSGARAT